MVLVLHYYLGLTLDEGAEALGIPPGTVRSRLNRATKAMRAALDADGRRDPIERTAVDMTSEPISTAS